MLAQFARFGAPVTVPSYVTAYSALLVVIWLSPAVFRSRSPRYIGAGTEEYRRVAAASFWTFGAIAMAELLLKLSISRGYLAVALPAGVLGLVLSRWMWRAYVARKRAHGAYSTAVLAVGSSDAVANLASELTDDPKNGYHVVGACITGYGAPRDEHLVVNNREIQSLAVPHTRCRRSVIAAPTQLRLPGRETSASKGCAGSSGSSSRWALISWCRQE